MTRLFLIGLFAMAALAGPAPAHDQGHGRAGDHDEALAAVERGETIPLARILPIVERAAPGEIVEVELEREDGRLIYEVEVLTQSGLVRKVEIDARTGAVLKVEDDD